MKQQAAASMEFAEAQDEMEDLELQLAAELGFDSIEEMEEALDREQGVDL